MATKSEKSARRWFVVKGLLISLAVYVVLMLGLVFGGVVIAPLDHISTLIFGLVGALGVGNWMTAPTTDD